MTTLPEHCQEILDRFFAQEQSYQEIASALGDPHGDNRQPDQPLPGQAARATRRMSMAEPDVELPAWSLRRDDPRAHTVARSWPHPIDREWAWSGSDGTGVRVAIVDSGIDSTHELVGGVQRAVAVEKGADGEVRVVPRTTRATSRAMAPLARESCARSRRTATSGASGCSGAGSKGGAVGPARRVALGGRGGLRGGQPEPLDAQARDGRALHEIADDAYFGGTVFVASAHNLDVRSYPWRFSSVVSVASHDGDDPFEFLYNPEPPVEFFARGMDIEVAWLDGSRIIAAGNSFATAHVTGICALILAKAPAADALPAQDGAAGDRQQHARDRDDG